MTGRAPIALAAVLALGAHCSEHRGVEFAAALDAVTSPEHRGMISVRTRDHLAPGTACDTYPAVGALVRRENGELHCTATLIRSRAVLTAAHCVQGVDPRSSLRFEVRGRDGELVQFDVVSVRVPKAYRRGQLGIADLAVLELDGSPQVAHLPFRHGSLPDIDGDVLEFVGYGYSARDGVGADGVKRCTQLPVNDVRAKTINYEFTKYDLCHGDSGGPALQRTTHGVEIVGVTSWGNGRCEGRGTSVNVGYYADWIDDVLSTITDPETMPDLDGPPVSADLCAPGAVTNGKRCLIYVRSPSDRDEARRAVTTLRARGVPDIQTWRTPSGRYAVTVCGGPGDCAAMKPVAERVRREIVRDAGFEFRVDRWELMTE